MKKVAFICVHNSCRSQIRNYKAKLHGSAYVHSDDFNYIITITVALKAKAI